MADSQDIKIPSPRIKDLTGRQFGRLRVVSFAGQARFGHAKWNCVCACGNTKVINSNNLLSGNTRSCTCWRAELIAMVKIPKPAYNFADLSGQTFGRLTVIAFAEVRPLGTKGTDRKAFWKCRCECGKEIVISGNAIKRANTRSCGCLRRETAAKTRTTHGMTKTAAHHSWVDAKQRCFNPHNQDFEEYGGRGISMEPAWIDSFETLLRDMGPRPPGGTLDRINNDLGYIRGNTRWASRLEQTRNRKKTITVNIAGETVSLVELAERMGLKYRRVHYLYLQNRLPIIMPASASGE